MPATATTSAGPPDAIVLLEQDHQAILKTFDDFEAAGERAHKTKGRLVDKMIELLTVHTYIGRDQLQELGEAMVEAKKKAPRSPAQPSALKKTVDAVLK